jgi:putative addiction module component (TIGR02574 family)
MPMSVSEIEAAVRALPAAEREALCERIAESLEVPLTVEEQAWADVAERRADELRTGKVQGVPADEVFRKARRKLGM